MRRPANFAKRFQRLTMDSRWRVQPPVGTSGKGNQMSHSGTSLAGVHAQGLVACPHAFEPTGFGYLLGPPKPEQRSRLGDDPAEALRLLTALSQALPAPAGYWKTPLRPGTHLDDNPFIPSGYTYLLQLVAHDAVQTSVPFWAAAQLGLSSRNLRSSRAGSRYPLWRWPQCGDRGLPNERKLHGRSASSFAWGDSMDRPNPSDAHSTTWPASTMAGPMP